MPNINTRKLIYHLKHRYLTVNNAVIAIAFIIAASWAWGSIEVMQRNYRLAQELNYKQRQAQLVELEAENLAFEQKYYQSREYQELAARDRLGLAMPGEKALVLPPNSQKAIEYDQVATPKVASEAQPDNFAQWLDFLFGGNRERLK